MIRDCLEEIDRRSDQVDRRTHPRLSGRQMQVLLAAANGWTAEETADQIAVSHQTVKTHRAITLRKLRPARAIPHAVTVAMAYGLIRPDQIRQPGATW
jgi:DNA-binding NarL/FixJ family response regulator